MTEPELDLKALQMLAKVREQGVESVNRYGLSDAEELFVQEYLVDGDAIRAYRTAGLKDHGDNKIVGLRAADLLRQDYIKTRIEQLRLRLQLKAELTREQYIDKILAVYERAMADGDYAGANKAMELVGKTLGHLIELKQSMNMRINKTIPADAPKEVKHAEIKRLARIAKFKFD